MAVERTRPRSRILAHMHRWLIQGLQRRPKWELLALFARLAAGAVFVGFGLGKFLRHESERDAFERYGIPSPDTATYLIGSLELIGGAALLLGLFVRPFAFLLACNMIAAIITAGRVEGGPVHLLLAPMLLAATLFLLWAGAGAASLDGRRASRHTGAA
ncbi:MAG TPA: DoxX family protein [Gaiellales bacterium]|nr:DoxX family protein [Gaiellales bacterium]